MSVKLSKGGKVKVFCEYSTSPNIALIKYWGKLDETEIIPLNTSMGVTLEQADLRTISKLTFSDKYEKDTIILNEKEHKVSERVAKILDFFRSERRHVLENLVFEGKPLKDLVDVSTLKLKLKSKNDFPTASGLASSSSGLAALSVCLCDIFQYQENVSQIARLGSGSACRSVYGGLVQWQGPEVEIVKQFYELQAQGKELDQKIIRELSLSCQSKSIYPEETFKNIEILILCDSFNEKEVPSTSGMLQTTQNSELLRARTTGLVQKRIQEINEALAKGDWNRVMAITIQDSNQFHATCLDTNPPIFYLNEFSKSVINLVHAFNNNNEHHIGYTYDAGPHSVLFIPTSVFAKFYHILATIFEFDQIQLNTRAKVSLQSLQSNKQIDEKEVQTYLKYKVRNPCYVIQTKVGNGPIKLK